ncbi:C-type lectin domain family 10 member A isoform X2 [Oreochromis niloticus]|uniref:C-type lectin domain family 10 member A isoform X2 n=1 Tax=Oreochromis niloticus TaxID=8128 RepID=UPI000904E69A|nr:C-type lectin domain family 10 member A isoform X2 [Oreochromis niloticus]
MEESYYENYWDKTTLSLTDSPAPSSASRFRRWLFPGLIVMVLLILIIVMGSTNRKMSNRLGTLEQRVSNLSNIIQSLNASLHHTQGSTTGGCCPVGWTVFESNCYFFSSDSRSWNESRDWCEAQQAHLLILHNDKEWDFVTRRSMPRFYWIGLSDWRTGSWEWVNQTPYTMEPRRWKPGQPDNWTGLGHGDEDCAHLYDDGLLNDVHCSTKMQFICQKPTANA